MSDNSTKVGGQDTSRSAEIPTETHDAKGLGEGVGSIVDNRSPDVVALDSVDVDTRKVVVEESSLEDGTREEVISRKPPMTTPLLTGTIPVKKEDIGLPPLPTHSRSNSGAGLGLTTGVDGVEGRLRNISLHVSPVVVNSNNESSLSSLLSDGSLKLATSGEDDDMTVVDDEVSDGSSEQFSRTGSSSPAFGDLHDYSTPPLTVITDSISHRRSVSDPFKKEASMSANGSLASSPAMNTAIKRVFSERLAYSPSYYSSSPSKIDRYGFLTEDSRYEVMSGNKNASSKRARIVLENQRTEKWVEMLRFFDKFRRRNPKILKRRIRKGIWG
jgi:hypothetical protein